MATSSVGGSGSPASAMQVPMASHSGKIMCDFSIYLWLIYVLLMKYLPFNTLLIYFCLLRRSRGLLFPQIHSLCFFKSKLVSSIEARFLIMYGTHVVDYLSIIHHHTNGHVESS